MATDTNSTTPSILNSLIEIRDLLKISKERGDAELHWLQLHRLFEESKEQIFVAVKKSSIPKWGAGMDFILPLGHACRPARQLKSAGLRMFSAPLDWMMVYPLDLAANLIIKGFKGFFSEPWEDEIRGKNKNNRYVVDRSTGMISMHGFSHAKSMEEELPMFHEKMLRRGKRLKEKILAAERIGVLMNRNEPDGVIIAFAEKMSAAFPNQRFYILNVWDDNTFSRNAKSRRLIRETEAYSICESRFKDEHELGTDPKTNPSFWLGNVDAWQKLIKEEFSLRENGCSAEISNEFRTILREIDLFIDIKLARRYKPETPHYSADAEFIHSDTDSTTSSILNSLIEIRDLLKISKERGDTELHWLQLRRLFEEFKERIVVAVKQEREAQTQENNECPVIEILKEIDDLTQFPLAWQYKENEPFRSIRDEFEIEDCFPVVEDAPFSDDTVDCVFITDDGYVNMTSIAINSICRSKDAKTKVRIFVVAAALSEYSCSLFRLQESENVSITIVRVSAEVLNELSGLHQYVKGGYCVATPAALLKFSLAELLPSLNRVIYLDGDTIILGDLKELFQMPLGDRLAAVVTDAWTLTSTRNPQIPRLKKYRFNSGMMLLNLSLMREKRMSSTLIEAKKRSKNFNLMDQLIFNENFAGKVRLISWKYNFLPVWYYQNKDVIKSKDFQKKALSLWGEEFPTPVQFLKKSLIVHFAGTEKPWNNSSIPFAREWLSSRDEFFELAKQAMIRGTIRADEPDVSIIIPVYNVEKYLARCLDSILAQTLLNIEVLCIDDGSTDGSSLILERYSKEDARVKVFRKANGGQGTARNLGIEKAKGQYIGFVDADDYVEPNMFETLLKQARSIDADVVECGAYVENAGEASSAYARGQQESLTYDDWEMLTPSRELFSGKFHACLWVKLYKKAFLTRVGACFSPILRKGEDAVFQWCYMPYCERYKRISKKLYHYVVGRPGSTETVKNPEQDWENHVAGCRIIYDCWKSGCAHLLDILLDRFWRIGRWRYSLCFDKEDTGLFERKMKESLSFFSYDEALPFLRNYSVAEQKILLRCLSRPQIIVSLTSFPARISRVHEVVESIFNQTWKADKIILWLADSQFPNNEKDLPEQLLVQRARGLEIRWCEDLRSYKKLIPALKAFPDDIIVTADDDLLFASTWLEDLVLTYTQNPKCICTHRAHEVSFLNSGEIAPYVKWRKEVKPINASFNNFQTGVCGCLYPPSTLHPDVLIRKKFTELCPHGDDIWFWAMAVHQGTKIKVSSQKYPLTYVDGSQEVALWRMNVHGGENDLAIKKVLDAYPSIISKLERISSDRPMESNSVVKKCVNNKNDCWRSRREPYWRRIGIRLVAMFIPNKAARKRFRERHMDLTPKDGVDINAYPEMHRDSALKRFSVRIASLFIFNKQARKAFREKHLNLTPRDGVDVRALSPEERRLRKQKKRERNVFRRLFNAIIPASRAKIAHTEKHLFLHTEQQTARILAEIRASRAQSERLFNGIKMELVRIREQNERTMRELGSAQKDALTQIRTELASKIEALDSRVEACIKSGREIFQQQNARDEDLVKTFDEVKSQVSGAVERYSGLEEILRESFLKRLENSGVVPNSLEFRTFGDLAHCIRKNLHKIPSDIDLVVGNPRSGIVPAYMIALFMNRRCCSLDEFLSGATGSVGIRPVEKRETRKVLIVDDSCYNGTAMEKVREKLKSCDGKYEFIYMAVYGRKDSADKLDFYLEPVEGRRVWQWNCLNHSLAGTACFDMDGVLCVDPAPTENDDGEKYIRFIKTATPLYIPTYEIHTIVTSRLEKYRAITEEWLRVNGVRYKELVMLDLPSAEERRRLKCHATFKADEYKKRPDTTLFVESEDWQAKEIAFLTGKQVLCVQTDKIY